MRPTGAFIRYAGHSGVLFPLAEFSIYKTRVSGARLGQRLLPADCTLGTTYSILVQVTNLRLGEIVQKPIHRAHHGPKVNTTDLTRSMGSPRVCLRLFMSG
ncbi:hypothetical protein E2C01_045508 [Portunus trituberculatus]|uniref:Uncharacterized protein n=1 Tax=Portunus trituberculatus TaxID=210409 RepID=A0A5B7G1D9_PORTR|nr:hypothetical protein [Portunus trituberculatus]